MEMDRKIARFGRACRIRRPLGEGSRRGRRSVRFPARSAPRFWLGDCYSRSRTDLVGDTSALSALNNWRNGQIWGRDTDRVVYGGRFAWKFPERRKDLQ